MEALVQHILSAFPRLDPATLELVRAAFERHPAPKGTQLLHQGDICKHLYFLSEGISRSYSLRDGQDITNWFSFRNDFITSYSSFFPKAPSYESIQMLTDGVLFRISYERLQELKEQASEIAELIDHFSVLYTVQLEQRLFVIQTHSATEKYRLMMEQEPHLIQHIPSKHLASYLGISRETLSRIRSRIN